MFKIIVLIVVVAVAGVLGYASTRPDVFRVERSASIKATPDKLFPLIADFHQWGAWSPWEKLDPAMKRSFTGAASGKGAAYAWEGDSKVGAGRMEVTDAQPTQITIQLDFIKPFEGHNIAEFTLTPNGDSTKVTWAMHGPAPFISKLMGLFFDMDKMIGKDFETGLANLKTVAEK
jgi:hypothetical protein